MPQQKMPNMQQLMAQAQKLQQQMMQAQEELKNQTVQASAGGGMVTVTVSGDLEVKQVRIDPAAVDPDDVDMLADMVLAAVRRGIAQRARSCLRPARRRWAAPPAAWISVAASAAWVCPGSHGRLLGPKPARPATSSLL